MLGPIPAARARKRAETLFRDRHATLTKSAALWSSRIGGRGVGEGGG